MGFQLGQYSAIDHELSRSAAVTEDGITSTVAFVGLRVSISKVLSQRQVLLLGFITSVFSFSGKPLTEKLR